MKIFISHSSEDAELVKSFIDILRKVFNLRTSDIRCTSVDGYKLPIGKRTNDALRDEVNNSDIFIGFITENALHSIYTIFEFGARWGTEKLFLPIVCAKDGMEILGGPLKDINAANGNNQASIISFLEEINKHIENDMENSASYLDDITSFVKLINTNSLNSELEKKDLSTSELLREFKLAEYKKAEEDRKKALIGVSTIKTKGGCEIVFRNTGAASARNIRVWSDFMEDPKHTAGIMSFQHKELFPYPLLHHGESFTLKTLMYEGHDLTAVMTITWDDDFAENNKREVVANF